MNLRQLCNVAFAAKWEQLKESPAAQEEFLEELRAPLDPMAQADELQYIHRAG